VNGAKKKKSGFFPEGCKGKKPLFFFLRREIENVIMGSMNKQGKYWKSAHTKHRMIYHIVWIPKYRKRVLVQKDHVHLLVQLKPDVSVSKAVQLFKGKSSYMIRKEYPHLKEFVWCGSKSFWADGYFVDTVGQVTEETIRDYIQNQ
jgi:REP-associated tyrosine transposase